MTGEKAITILQHLAEIISSGDYQETFKMAASALRPITREQVEQVWGGCEWCDEEWGTCDPITNRFTMPPRGGIRFCPMCGKPLRDEAVDILLKRLEALHGKT